MPASQTAEFQLTSCCCRLASWCENDPKGPEFRTAGPNGEFAIGITVSGSVLVVQNVGGNRLVHYPFAINEALCKTM